MQNIKVIFRTNIVRGGNTPQRIRFISEARLRVGSHVSVGDNVNAVSGCVVEGDYLGNYTLDTSR